MCAAASSSGVVPLMHVVGITPEAPDLATALGPNEDAPRIDLTQEHTRAARNQLSSSSGDRLGAISLGTPHYSNAEIVDLLTALNGRSIHPSVDFYVNTGRDVLAAAGDAGGALSELGIQFVTDTCTYVTPVMKPVKGAAMTDSAKWAYYAPGNIGVEVVFGSLSECVESAVAGEVVRDPALWGEE
jgi:predicted aconitase